MPAIQPDANGGAALLSYVGGTAGVDDDRAAEVYSDAYGQVMRYLGTLELDETPSTGDVHDVKTVQNVVLEVGSKLWDRRNAPGGEVMVDTDGTPGRLAPRDPLVTAYPVLQRLLDSHDGPDGAYLGGCFA